MVTPYFFTDCDVMPEQDAALGYGSVSATSFRLTSSFTTSVGGAALRAYAVCRGAVLIQEVDGHPDLVNLVLKPERQPNPNYAPVEFFVYRGLKKKHFLDSANEVIGDGSADKVTDLMTRMWEVRNRLNDDIAAADEGALPEPLVRGDLELSDLGDPPSDSATPVAELFDTYTFAIVSEGDFIGEFETAAIYGFECILLASPAHQHVLGEMRALERSTTIVYPAGQAQFPAAEDISIRRERERILAFVDPAAWYGLFALERVHAYRGGRDRTLNGEDLYADVLRKFHTADRIYVDIRDEFDNSLNYLGEYGSGSASVQWASGGGPLVAFDYHDGNGWPVLVLRASQIASGSDAAVGLSIALPKGASELVTGYLAHASLLADFPNRIQRFVNLGFNGSTWADAFEIGLHNNPSAGAVYPAMVQIAVGKRIDPATFTKQRSVSPLHQERPARQPIPAALHRPGGQSRPRRAGRRCPSLVMWDGHQPPGGTSWSRAGSLAIRSARSPSVTATGRPRWRRHGIRAVDERHEPGCRHRGLVLVLPYAAGPARAGTSRGADDRDRIGRRDRLVRRSPRTATSRSIRSIAPATTSTALPTPNPSARTSWHFTTPGSGRKRHGSTSHCKRRCAATSRTSRISSSSSASRASSSTPRPGRT